MAADDLEEAFIAFFESQQQAADDFVGEQREWHLPRLNKAARIFLQQFPGIAGAALVKAKSPYETKNGPAGDLRNA